MMISFGFFTFCVAAEEKRLIPKELVREFQRETTTRFISGSTFLVTALPFFFNH